MMNKLTLLLFSFNCMFFFSQENETKNNRELNTENIMLYAEIAKPASTEIEGSPYLYEDFQDAKVEGFSQINKMRYNAANDEVEFMKGGQKYVLYKQKPYEVINFLTTNEVLKLLEYKYKEAIKNGYLFVILKTPEVTLYRKINIVFNKAVHASSSYDKEMPARYSRNSDVFFVQKNQEEITELPLNKKKIEEMFPEKKDFIEKSFKSKNIDLSDLNNFQNFLKIFQK